MWITLSSSLVYKLHISEYGKKKKKPLLSANGQKEKENSGCQQNKETNSKEYNKKKRFKVTVKKISKRLK